MSETTEPAAPPEPPRPAKPAPPQTCNIFVDRPCLKCGYNLRGQTATWNRKALNWAVTCPECASKQVVVLGTSERHFGANPMFALALAVIGGWIVWQLVMYVAVSQAVMMTTPADAQLNVTPRAFAAALAAGTTPTAVSASAASLAVHLALYGMPVAMGAVGLGLIISLARYATRRQQNILLVVLLAFACTYGLHMNLTDQVPDPSQAQARAQRQAIISRGLVAPVVILYDWKWKLLSGSAGLLIGLAAGRAGLAVGWPLGRMVATMYVKPAE